MFTSALVALSSFSLSQVYGATDSCSIQSSSSSYGVWGGSSASYDKAESEETLMLAYAAYAPKEKLENWNCGCCTKTDILSKLIVTYVHDASSNQAYSGYYLDASGKRVLVLSFRGTYNPCGWICNDFDADLVPYPGVENGKIYEGFYRVWQSAADGNDTSYYGYKNVFVPKMIQLLDQFCVRGQASESCEMVITGHSLGAALAQVAAVTFADFFKESGDKYDCKLKVYNYGSPRWANMALSSYYNDHESISMQWRVVNGYDVVPMLPPVVLGHWHATTQVWYEHGLSEPYVGSDKNGEFNKEGHDLRECFSHANIAKSCINDHTTYLNYYYDGGECTVVNAQTMTRISEQNRATPDSRIAVLPNPICENLCK